MRQRLAGECPKFEKIYFFKEIYLISRKINFGSIVILIGWSRPNNPPKLHKNAAFWLKMHKKRLKISNKFQVMHHRLAGECQKFEKNYFFIEIYLISKKINFWSIVILIGWGRPHNPQKLVKNAPFWLKMH